MTLYKYTIRVLSLTSTALLEVDCTVEDVTHLTGAGIKYGVLSPPCWTSMSTHKCGSECVETFLQAAVFLINTVLIVISSIYFVGKSLWRWRTLQQHQQPLTGQAQIPILLHPPPYPQAFSACLRRRLMIASRSCRTAPP